MNCRLQRMEKEMENLRKQLHQVVNGQRKNLSDQQVVLPMSKKLDVLIIEYLKELKKVKSE